MHRVNVVQLNLKYPCNYLNYNNYNNNYINYVTILGRSYIQTHSGGASTFNMQTE